MFGTKRATELQEAKHRYDKACSRYEQMVELNMVGQISDSELLDAKNELFRAKVGFQEVSYGDDHYG